VPDLRSGAVGHQTVCIAYSLQSPVGGLPPLLANA
jgi:hypothetical protein